MRITPIKQITFKRLPGDYNKRSKNYEKTFNFSNHFVDVNNMLCKGRTTTTTGDSEQSGIFYR